MRGGSGGGLLPGTNPCQHPPSRHYPHPCPVLTVCMLNTRSRVTSFHRCSAYHLRPPLTESRARVRAHPVSTPFPLAGEPEHAVTEASSTCFLQIDTLPFPSHPIPSPPFPHSHYEFITPPPLRWTLFSVKFHHTNILSSYTLWNEDDSNIL